MKLKHAIEIPNGVNADSFQNCKLGRKPYAEVLTQIVENYADGFVLALDNEWGAGKTTFIKMWRQDLMNKGFKTLFYNAWENDFEKDVLVALISELKELEDRKTKKVFKKIIDNAAPFTTKLLPSLAKNLATTYIGEDFVKELVSGLAEVTSENLKTELQEYANRKKGLKDFRRSLAEFVKLVDPEKPVVFFIDELDRCRPNYAVEVLEQVKHLFSVRGIVFVLSVDKEQLGHAVRGVYGSEQINVQEYLRRFIDLEYNLPVPEKNKILDYLWEYYLLGEFFSNDRPRQYINDPFEFRSFALHLFHIADLNFRQQEKLFGHIKVIFNITKGNENIIPPVLLYLVYLKQHRTHLYFKIKHKKLSAQELFTDCEKSIPETIFENNGFRPFYEFFILFADLYNSCLENSKPLFQNSGELPEYSLKTKFGDSSEELKKIIRRLNDKYWYSSKDLDVIINKVELLENLRF